MTYSSYSSNLENFQFYSALHGRVLNSTEVRFKTGIPVRDHRERPSGLVRDSDPTPYFERLNYSKIYPVISVRDTYNPIFYSTTVSYTVGNYTGNPLIFGMISGPAGDYATPVYTATAIPLADAKAAAIDILKERSNEAAAKATNGFSVLALAAAASKDASNRDSTIQTVLDGVNAILTQLSSNVTAVNSAITVEDIDALVNPPVTYTVTVANGEYNLDNDPKPDLSVLVGKTYIFDQSDPSNSGHPLKIYTSRDKTTEITRGVTVYGTPGSSGAYTQYAPDGTNLTAYYQCSAHAAMGNYIKINHESIVTS